MKSRFLMAFTFLVAVSSCTPPALSIQTATALNPGSSRTPAPTLPTDTPPSSTPIPTFTPKPPTHTPVATISPTASPAAIACAGAPAISIQRNSWARVSSQPPISSNVRAGPGLQANKIGTLKPGEIIWIVDGPRCADNFNWWLVRSMTRLEGWTAEGDTANYWLVQSEETFLYDTADLSATSNTVLEREIDYQITLAGTFSIWIPEQWTDPGVCIRGHSEELPMFPSPSRKNGLVGADPFHQFARPFYGPCQTLLDPGEKNGTIMLSLDDGITYFIPTPTSAQSREDHTYTYVVTGLGHPLRIRLDDTHLEDNYGRILIIIDQTE